MAKLHEVGEVIEGIAVSLTSCIVCSQNIKGRVAGDRILGIKNTRVKIAVMVRYNNKFGYAHVGTCAVGLERA